MTPNVVSISSGPSRRSFLASTAVATAAVAGEMPLLTACGGSDSESREGTASGKAPFVQRHFKKGMLTGG
ncbi:predicted protein [Streptomyces viridochromogenes DSM 40736]|uniref:Predicted protein n=1 Tax=Streptomyces viridochromogenes (strain DSM 40736 / JCM 4977 / BCRC 1201 / Tue 494) TaxID=591159 RepID=D9XAI8_STRVT|nr:predicted protein [Streptomyces viridochromogenes DSM 40736]